jgi:hypothetical protein
VVFALANDVAKDPAVASYLPGWGRGPCALPSRLHAARIGFFENQQLGFAAHLTLEAQRGECPRKGFFHYLCIGRMSWNEVDGTFEVVGERAHPPAQE